MPSIFKFSFVAGMVLALLVGLWLAQLWPAENQVRLHSEHFLRQIEKRHAAAAIDFLAADYHDDWGHDRSLLLERLHLVLRAFSSLTITADNPQVRLAASSATWSAHVQIAGTGAEYAPENIARVNGLTKPFELEWRHESWKPWDWKLVRVTNPELQLSGGMD